MKSRKLYGIYTPAQGVSATKIKSDITQALDAGLNWLQIRDKSNHRQLWPVWQEIAGLIQNYNTQLIINDNVDLLLETQKNWTKPQLKPGLHLGQGDTSLKEARQKLSPETIIGVTCHNSVALAEEAINNGADYVAFGRFFPSKTKPDAQQAQISTIEAFHKLYQPSNKNHNNIAVIGGINIETIQQLINSPARLFAVSDGIWGQASIHNAVQDLLRVLSTYSTKD